MQETWVQPLGWEDPLEEEMVTHYRILTWRIPWTEEPGGLQSMGLQRVGHDCGAKQQLPRGTCINIAMASVCFWLCCFASLGFRTHETPGRGQGRGCSGQSALGAFLVLSSGSHSSARPPLKVFKSSWKVKSYFRKQNK